MFRVRRAKVEDVGTLLKLAKMVHFINLPPDADIIRRKIAQSRAAFIRAARGQRLEPAGPAKGGGLDASLAQTDVFVFALEEIESRGVLGTSQVIAHMGGAENPNWSLKIERRHFYSDDIHAGTTHATATLYADESGPSEIGGLILQPSYRGHKLRLGRFVSLVRFHFIALHRELFADEVLAEMMAPISAQGENLLWNALGRRFIPLSYEEADRHCQISRDFIANLLPREPIYLTLLPPAARDVVGAVGEETKPARRMLEKMGFEYQDFVDPFDGGPHLRARTDDIEIVRNTHSATLGETVAKSKCTHKGIVSALDTDGEFSAVNAPFAIDPSGDVRLSREVMAALGAEPGVKVGVTVMDGPEVKRARKATTKKPGGSKKTVKRTTKKAGKKVSRKGK